MSRLPDLSLASTFILGSSSYCLLFSLLLLPDLAYYVTRSKWVCLRPCYGSGYTLGWGYECGHQLHKEGSVLAEFGVDPGE